MRGSTMGKCMSFLHLLQHAASIAARLAYGCARCLTWHVSCEPAGRSVKVQQATANLLA